MKKIILLSLFALGSAAYAQTETDSTRTIYERKHEVKLGAVKLLAGGIFEGTYEYIKSKDFTFGASALVNFDRDNEYPEDFSVTPFARFYFQEAKEYGARGFFVEGFAKYFSGRTYEEHYALYPDDNDYEIYEKEESFSAGAIGLALGRKWINHNGFVLEILFGAGRVFGGNDDTPDAVFRGDLSLGYRF